MILMAKVEALFITKRGRFVCLEIESLPKGFYMRKFHVPSETLNLGDRVKITIEVQSKPEPAQLRAKGCLPTIEQMSGLVEDFTEGKPLREYLEDLDD